MVRAEWITEGLQWPRVGSIGNAWPAIGCGVRGSVEEGAWLFQPDEKDPYEPEGAASYCDPSDIRVIS